MFPSCHPWSGLSHISFPSFHFVSPCHFHCHQNDVDSIRLRTAEYEMIVAQHGNFTIIVTQDRDPNAASKAIVVGAEGEKKEGEAEKKAAE